MFWIIASSGITDERYSARHFSRVPLEEVVRLQRFLDRQQRIRTNASSIATARLSMVVIGALAGKSGSQAKLEHFLPYDIKELAQEPEERMTPATARVVQRLIRNRRLPMKITAMLVDELRNYATPTD